MSVLIVLVAHSGVSTALQRLIGLAGTVYELRKLCLPYVLLILLCIFRTGLTLTAAELNVIPYWILPETVEEYISVRLNDVVTVAIYVLVPFLCGRSIVGLYGSFQLTSLRQLFNEVNPLKPIPIIIFVFTSVSAGYMLKLVYFIYNEWTKKFNPLVQTFQFTPALLIICQTLCQGIFFLQAFANRKHLDVILRPDYNTCLEQFQYNKLLNATLIVHCASILAVVWFKYDQHDKLNTTLAVGEIVYRFFAVGTFVYLISRIQKNSNDGSTVTSKQPVLESTHCDPSTSKMVT